MVVVVVVVLMTGVESVAETIEVVVSRDDSSNNNIINNNDNSSSSINYNSHSNILSWVKRQNHLRGYTKWFLIADIYNSHVVFNTALSGYSRLFVSGDLLSW